MDPADATTAADILRDSTVRQLAETLEKYGEIRNPARMAETIKNCIKHGDLKTSVDLKNCLQNEYGSAMKIKVLAKLFQALRIAVNDELSELSRCCEQAVLRLRQGGRLVVISYHSLEDRFVKNFMRDAEKGCVCPSGIPVCVCGGKKTLKRIITRAIVSSPDEIKRNPASRSARLRVAEKIGPL
jgi:16S rRNA (cytosine1402-N4)-methyltransferase